MFIYFWRDRERQSISRGGAEREGDIESEAGSRLGGVSTEPTVGFELMNHGIMTWAKVGHLTHWAIQGPLQYISFLFQLTRVRVCYLEWKNPCHTKIWLNDNKLNFMLRSLYLYIHIFIIYILYTIITNNLNMVLI